MSDKVKRCSFCNRPRPDVDFMIEAAKGGPRICSVCLEEANKIAADQRPEIKFDEMTGEVTTDEAQS